MEAPQLHQLNGFWNMKISSALVWRSEKHCCCFKSENGNLTCFIFWQSRRHIKQFYITSDLNISYHRYDFMIIKSLHLGTVLPFSFRWEYIVSPLEKLIPSVFSDSGWRCFFLFRKNFILDSVIENHDYTLPLLKH